MPKKAELAIHDHFLKNFNLLKNGQKLTFFENSFFYMMGKIYLKK